METLDFYTDIFNLDDKLYQKVRTNIVSVTNDIDDDVVEFIESMPPAI